MAFARVISLKHTIKHLQKSSQFSLVPPSEKIMEFAYRQVKSLVVVIKELDISGRERLNALDRDLREAVSKLEDAIESHLSDQILSQSEKSDPLLFSIDLNMHDLKQHIQSFTKAVKKMEAEYINALCNPLPEEEVEDGAVSSRIHFDGNKSKLVGVSYRFGELKRLLTRHHSSERGVLPLLGMAGIGKTALSKEAFEDPDVVSHFECRAWVTVGKKCQVKGIQRAILAQMIKPVNDKILSRGDDKIAQYLRESLKGKRYLIVLDDVWDTRIWQDLKTLLPNDMNQSQILLTTRLRKVAQDVAKAHATFKVRLLCEDESWNLLREKVFGEKLCPPELEKDGKRIAARCEGLPLTIVAVADLLSKAQKTPGYWRKVATQKEHPVFISAYDRISKVIFPSYEHLPQRLKACFLYMGVFPQNYEIRASMLFNLWSSERFLEADNFTILRYEVMECLEALVSNSLLMFHNKRIKTFHLHSSMHYLCRREAGKNKFFHMLNTHANGLAEGIKSQRGLCIHNSILFSIKNVHDSMENNCASSARSLLCFGPNHKYPVPICFGLRLLRVLRALTIPLYEFPKEALKLVHLRYLAITSNGKLPASISKLWNLEVLIVLRRQSIKSYGARSYLPMEIWNMKELKHLQVMGSDLPDPCGRAILANLSTLLNVSAHSCTGGVLKAIPNLEKLGIRIELAHGDDGKQPLSCFDHISHLHKLESLKCVVVNPELKSEVGAPPASLPVFPSSLKKLSLSGLGYPWQEMSKIASLPNLETLKLRSYAFRGPMWEVKAWGFPRLKYLLIADTDLVEWKIGILSLDMVFDLTIGHCYKLKKIDGYFPRVADVVLVDCDPLTVTCVKEAQGRRFEDTYVRCSWND